jgi:glucose-6-phosphate 1-dehydrogenase
MDQEEFHKRVSQCIKAPIPAMKKKLEDYLGICSYVDGQYNEDASFQRLEEAIKNKEKDFKGSDRHRIFYMALPPSVFIDVATGLKKNNVRDHQDKEHQFRGTSSSFESVSELLAPSDLICMFDS